MPGEETAVAEPVTTPEAVATPSAATPAPETSVSTQPAATDSTTSKPSTDDKDLSVFRNKADLFDSLTRDPEFREWYTGRNKEKPTEVKQDPGLSDEEIAALWADPKRYNQHLEQRIEAKARELIGPAMAKAEREIELLKRTREIENTASIHKDFWDLDEKGLIERTMKKYPNLSAEDAYWLSKREVLEADALKQAHAAVDKKRGLVVEKPGVTVSSTKVVKVRNKTELMEKAYEYAKRGEEPPEFEIEGR